MKNDFSRGKQSLIKMQQRRCLLSFLSMLSLATINSCPSARANADETATPTTNQSTNQPETTLQALKASLATESSSDENSSRQNSENATQKQSKILNGEVSRSHLNLNQNVDSTSDAQDSHANNDNVEKTDNAMTINSKHVTIIINGQRALFDSTGGHLHSFHKLSTEQYRKMGFGIIGVQVLNTFVEGKLPAIIQLLPDCPAIQAGIQVGDEIVKGNDHYFKSGEGQREFMAAIGGKAGTPVDITVRRNGTLIDFHLIRMNIEDIADQKTRLKYEMILSMIGEQSLGITNSATEERGYADGHDPDSR